MRAWFVAFLVLLVVAGMLFLGDSPLVSAADGDEEGQANITVYIAKDTAGPKVNIAIRDIDFTHFDVLGFVCDPDLIDGREGVGIINGATVIVTIEGTETVTTLDEDGLFLVENVQTMVTGRDPPWHIVVEVEDALGNPYELSSTVGTIQPDTSKDLMSMSITGSMTDQSWAWCGGNYILFTASLPDGVEVYIEKFKAYMKWNRAWCGGGCYRYEWADVYWYDLADNQKCTDGQFHCCEDTRNDCDDIDLLVDTWVSTDTTKCGSNLFHKPTCRNDLSDGMDLCCEDQLSGFKVELKRRPLKFVLDDLKPECAAGFSFNCTPDIACSDYYAYDVTGKGATVGKGAQCKTDSGASLPECESGVLKTKPDTRDDVFGCIGTELCTCYTTIDCEGQGGYCDATFGNGDCTTGCTLGGTFSHCDSAAGHLLAVCEEPVAQTKCGTGNTQVLNRSSDPPIGGLVDCATSCSCFEKQTDCDTLNGKWCGCTNETGCGTEFVPHTCTDCSVLPGGLCEGSLYAFCESSGSIPRCDVTNPSAVLNTKINTGEDSTCTGSDKCVCYNATVCLVEGTTCSGSPGSATCS
ncbi:hypothetical protein K8R43_04045 [archaeon]|nr:hypothetical protein [archaeon]